jgi:leucyl aminopeptidase
MTVPTLSTSFKSPLEIEADVLVLGVRKTDVGPVLVTSIPAGEVESVQASLAAIGATGAQDELRRLPATFGLAASIALIGVGSGVPTQESLRYAAGSATRQLRGVKSIAFALPAESDDAVFAILEGAAIGAYGYTQYRSSVEASTLPATEVIVATSNRNATLATRASVIAAATSNARDLVNMPPSHLFPESFAAAARALATGSPVTVTVLGEQELADGGYGGILGVGKGSTRGPRLVKVAYEPLGAQKHLALVGKGITFDSGGLSLKPPASMIGMKYDMTGAATALAVVLAAAQLALPVRITAWLCLAENMPSGSAMRPNDVITIRGGKTVEVLNTDAEGRLVLADGLVAASEEQPDAIIDIATLTGAAAIAMGLRFVATMGDPDLVSQVVEAGKRVGETLWPMPIPSELRPMLASDIADIANVKPGNTAGGMMIAAAFLKEFVGSRSEGEEKTSIPWAHLDIANAANNGGTGWGFVGKGPTGVTIRALIELADEFSRP